MNISLPEVGTSLEIVHFGPIGIAEIQRYAIASLDDNPLHTDINAALAVGLDAPVLHGMMLMGQFERLITTWRPGIKVIRLHTSFLQPVRVGSRISISGRVVKIVHENNNDEIILRLFVRLDQGEVACIGEALVRISPPPSPGSVLTTAH